eukprot:2342691-Alexandrium_andersonii.AAC.1
MVARPVEFRPWVRPPEVCLRPAEFIIRDSAVLPAPVLPPAGDAQSVKQLRLQTLMRRLHR